MNEKNNSTNIDNIEVTEQPPVTPNTKSDSSAQTEKTTIVDSSVTPSATTPIGDDLNSKASVGGVEVPKNSKKKRRTVLLVVAVLLLLVCSGVALAYNHLNNKPEKVLADALTNTVSDLLDKKPVSVLGSFTYESKGKEPVKLTIKFDGKTSNTDNSGTADVTAVYKSKTYKLKTSVTTFNDEEYYFKLENLKQMYTDLAGSHPEASSYSEVIVPVIEKIDNKWVKVTKEDVVKYTGIKEETVNKCGDSVEQMKLTKADKKELKKLFKSNQFIIATENLKSEKVDSESSFHYKLDFNNKTAEGFAKRVLDLESFKSVKENCKIDDQRIENTFKDDLTSEKNGSKPVVELWVGKQSRRPTKFRVSRGDKDVTIDFTSQIKLNAKDVMIEKPKDFISIQEVIKVIEDRSGSSVPTAPAATATSTNDIKRKTEGRRVAARLNEYLSDKGVVPTRSFGKAGSTSNQATFNGFINDYMKGADFKDPTGISFNSVSQLTKIGDIVYTPGADCSGGKANDAFNVVIKLDSGNACYDNL